MKKFVSYLLLAVMIFSALPAGALTAAAEEETPVTDYVSSALVSLYTGAGHSSEDDVWEDLWGDNDISVTRSDNSYFTSEGYFLGGESCPLPSALLTAMKADEFTVELVLGDIEAVDVSQNSYITLLSNNGGTTAEKFSLYIQTSKGAMDKLFVKSSGLATANRPSVAEGGKDLAANSTVSFTYKSGGAASLYVDGVLLSETEAAASNGNNVSSANSLNLGDARVTNSSNTLFKGMRFYTKALSAAEIAGNYAVDCGAVPSSKKLNGDYITRGLVSLYNGVGYESTDTIWADEYGENDITGLLPDPETGVGFESEGWRVIGTKHAMPTALLSTLAGEEFTFEMRLGDVAALDLSTSNYITFIANNGGSTSELFAIYVQTSKGTLDKFFVKTSGLSSANRPVVNSGGTELACDSTISVTFKAGGSVKLYADGVLLATKTAPATNGNVLTKMTNLYFGESNSTKTHNALYKGFRFYECELSASEIKHNFAADKTIVPIDPSTEEPERGDPTSLGYVEDGLVSLYDGLCNSRFGHADNAKTWVDLWGDNDFKVTYNSTGRFTENAYYVNSSEFNFPSPLLSVINGSAFTVEMALGDFETIAGTTYATLLNTTANDNFALFWRRSTGDLELKTATNSRVLVANGEQILKNSTVSVTYEQNGMILLYINGRLAGSATASALVNGTGTLKFGNSDAAKKHIAEFKGFRFYNRALTANEVKENALIDGTYDPNVVSDQEFVKVRQPHTGIVGDVALYEYVKNSSAFDALNGLAVPPSNAVFYINSDLETTDENGENAFSDVAAVFETLDGILPVFYVKDEETVAALTGYLSENKLFDCTVMSDDPALVKSARTLYGRVRGAIDISKAYTSALTEDDLIVIRKAVNTNLAKIVFLSPGAASDADIKWLNSRELTACLALDETPDTEGALRALLSGAYGILSPSGAVIYNACRNYIPSGTLTRFPQNVAHRGYFKDVPENTLEAMIAAYEEGADAVEMDIYITTDGELAVNHDASTTLYNQKLTVENCTMAQLKELYITKNGVQYRMPTMREIFEYFKDKDGMMFRIEIKSSKPATVTALKALIEEYDFYGRCTVITFAATGAAATMAEVYPEMPVSLLYGTGNGWADTEMSVRYVQDLIGNYNATFAPTSAGYTADFIDAALKRGITTWVWTLSTESTIYPYLLYGHSGITGNDCTVLAKIAERFEASVPAAVLTGTEYSVSGELSYKDGSKKDAVGILLNTVKGQAVTDTSLFTASAPGQILLLPAHIVQLGSYGYYTLCAPLAEVTAYDVCPHEYGEWTDSSVQGCKERTCRICGAKELILKGAYTEEQQTQILALAPVAVYYNVPESEQFFAEVLASSGVTVKKLLEAQSIVKVCERTDGGSGKVVSFVGSINAAELDFDRLELSLHFTSGTDHADVTARVNRIYTTLNGVASTDAATAAAQGVEYIDAFCLYGLSLKGMPEGGYSAVLTVNGVENGQTVCTDSVSVLINV